MSTITRGKGTLGRLYERLRKRSYRRMIKGAYLFSPEREYYPEDHEAYLAGVHDALLSVEEIMEDLTHGR